jgi:hypothetical protein
LTTGQPEIAAQVGDPAGDGAGLEDHQRRALTLQQLAEVLRVGVDRGEAACRGARVVKAGDALELAEVEAENRVHLRGSLGVSVRELSYLKDTRLEGPRGLHGFFRRRASL